MQKKIAGNYDKAKKEKYRYDGKKELDLKETINHVNTMQKVKEDEVNADKERCTRQIRATSPKVISLTSREYRESAFWDHVHGEDS